MNDIVIVGAGTAGCVLADRLSRSGRLRVLLIEAGGKPSSPFVKIPAGFARLFRGKHDWAFESEPQKAAAGRRVFTPRGKMLGGSSNMNAQIHQWCHPTDFEEWVAAGASGWGWEEVAPIFREQECWLGEEGNGARGRTGPMMVSPNRNAHRLSHAFVDAARAAGLGDQPHYNGDAFEGAWLAEIAHKDGQRFSAYDAYLKPALGRPNLEILRDAHVVRVEIANGRASGVTVRVEGEEKTLSARGVVLAAGAFGSPQILMLSGVGPAEQLARLGIPVYYDAPEVGENLQDHPMVPVIFRTRGTDTFKKAESPLNLLRYLLFKRGMLASNAVEAFAFTHSSGARGLAPDIELIFAPFEWRAQGLEPPSVDAFSFGVAVVAPRSRGVLRLRSAEPMEAPFIDFGLLTDPEGIDAAAILAGARLARKTATLSPLADFVDQEFYPGAAVNEDAELLALLASQIQTVYHPTSTCRMGTDLRAVVTPQLEVRGVNGLWVSDASVMPAVPRGHPNAVVAMIANRAAEMIAYRLTAA
ncbi:MAG: GMC family oxidoreductase N-terminal domain-containing protein [Blastocatellia bacterium]|nr:GMC family oxidoreductase N-terminal domain-containing protein [Blastocatellia bacterium]